MRKRIKENVIFLRKKTAEKSVTTIISVVGRGAAFAVKLKLDEELFEY